jgi:wobble nucleotide-excising tRNase
MVPYQWDTLDRLGLFEVWEGRWQGAEMIIKKIVKVENVGRFTKLLPTGDVEFRKLTLLYGENGRGKTTIAAMIRSLKTGHAAHITERATLGASGGQTIEVLLGTGGVAKFANGAWNHAFADIEIFDAIFVREKASRRNTGKTCMRS